MIPTPPVLLTVEGFVCQLDEALGHLTVAHDGTITWDQLQAVKNAVWGKDARAIEVYPRADQLVNTGNYRHLWRLGRADFCPDLLHHSASRPSVDSLEARHAAAWKEAEEVFR